MCWKILIYLAKLIAIHKQFTVTTNLKIERSCISLHSSHCPVCKDYGKTSTIKNGYKVYVKRVCTSIHERVIFCQFLAFFEALKAVGLARHKFEAGIRTIEHKRMGYRGKTW